MLTSGEYKTRMQNEIRVSLHSIHIVSRIWESIRFIPNICLWTIAYVWFAVTPLAFYVRLLKGRLEFSKEIQYVSLSSLIKDSDFAGDQNFIERGSPLYDSKVLRH